MSFFGVNIFDVGTPIEINWHFQKNFWIFILKIFLLRNSGCIAICRSAICWLMICRHIICRQLFAKSKFAKLANRTRKSQCFKTMPGSALGSLGAPFGRKPLLVRLHQYCLSLQVVKTMLALLKRRFGKL